MQFRELKVPGAWEITPRQHADERGVFLEWFAEAPFAAHLGQGLRLAQANASVSAVGVVRGIHFADVPPGQAKYVTCPSGAVWDVVVDLRLGSATFGTWDAVLLDDVDRRAVYLSEGLGHGFCALQDGSTVVYLCSEPYAPAREHGVDPFDPDLAITWPTRSRDGTPMQLRTSPKDAEAPGLHEARTAGLLPSMADVAAYVAGLRSTR